MHFNSSQSRSAWTEQEDDLLRNAVGIYGERSWANVAQMVPGRSSKSCSDRWRNFLSPDIEHPRKSPFTEWEIAVVVLAQARYGNNWKAISMLLPGRTNRAVKNLFVGNLKWGARLPEIRNRFLEWGMTLESLLEIKPDRAGGPVKPRPGQVLPDGTNGTSQDGSPLSGSPASTSSAGSAWQSDMTDHPNGSPGSANTSERRRRAEGEMAAQAGQQSSPVIKRRRGAQSPVLGGSLQHHGQSSSLAPHPGALGPSFTGTGGNGTGSPTLGITIPGTMGPPANRHPNAFVSLDPSNGLLLTKQAGGSSNGSNDGTSALIMPPGSEATPTSHLTGSEHCGSLTPGGALTATLAGGCFGSGAAALGVVTQAGGQRAGSMPCGGLQQLLMSDACMTGRVASWHHPGQMFAAAGGAVLDPAAAAAMAAARPASPFQQHGVQATAVAAAGVPGSLTSLLTDGNDMGTAAAGQAGAAPVVKAESAADAAVGYQMQQQQHQHQQQQQFWMHQQHYHHQQQQQQQRLAQHHAQLQYHHQQQQHYQQLQQHTHQQQMCGAVNPAQDPAAAAAATRPGELPAMQGASNPGMLGQHQQQQQPHQQQSQLLQAGGVHEGATTASIVASAAMELALPSSPILAGNILQDMRSNDSAGLHSMLDQILNEDLNMADSSLALLGASSDGLPLAPQRSSAFDPPIISLPTPPEDPPSQGDAGGAAPSPHPQAPPPTPQGGVLPGGMGMGQFGGGSSSSSSRPSGGQHMAQLWGGEYACAQTGGRINSSSQLPGMGHSSHNPHQAVDAAAHQQAAMQQQHQQAHQQAQQQQLSQQQPPHHQQQQQQQQPADPQGLPPRPGSSAGMAAQGAGMQAASPQPPAMSMLCAQLQQENMLLMHKLHQMETHVAGPALGDAAAAAALPADPAAAAARGADTGMGAHPAAAAAQGSQPQAAVAAAAAAAAAAAPPAAAAPNCGPWSGFDALMPQLRPVLTRVGGSAGGGLSTGGSLGGMCPPSSLVAESPAQLINTVFLDDHCLLGDL